MVLSSDELLEAETRIRPHLPPTPLVRSPCLSEKLGVGVFLKLEMLQPTRSFKVRGAFNALLALAPDQRERGVVAASQGNHGLGLALAASQLDVRATVYLPRAAPAFRVQTLRALGADVRLQGDSWDAAHREAIGAAQLDGRVYVHPFDDPRVMAGQGTVLLEVLRQTSDVDLVVASAGGGGLLAGLASAAHHFSPRTRLVGVETAGADCLYQSRNAGTLVELPAVTSIASSLGARRSTQRPFEIVQRLVSDLVLVSDREAVEGLSFLLRTQSLLVEPAAACCVAALLSERVGLGGIHSIVVVVCGANVTAADALKWSQTFDVPL